MKLLKKIFFLSSILLCKTTFGMLSSASRGISTELKEEKDGLIILCELYKSIINSLTENADLKVFSKRYSNIIKNEIEKQRKESLDFKEITDRYFFYITTDIKVFETEYNGKIRVDLLFFPFDKNTQTSKNSLKAKRDRLGELFGKNIEDTKEKLAKSTLLPQIFSNLTPPPNSYTTKIKYSFCGTRRLNGVLYKKFFEN